MNQFGGNSVLSLVGANLVKDDPTKSWVGVRTKLGVVGNAGLTTPIVALASDIWPSGAGITLMTYSELGGTTIQELIGREFYLEFGFDWVNKTIERRINGEFHSTILPASFASLFTPAVSVVYFSCTYTVQHQQQFRDFYWADYTSGDLPNAPLGIQRCVMMEETVEAETPWAPVGTTLQNVLNQKIDANWSDTTLIDTPVLQYEGAGTPLNVGLKFPAGTKVGAVNAVVGFITAGLTSGNPGSVSTSLKRNGQSNAPAVTAVASSMTHMRPTFLEHKTPDGQRWTKESLESTTLSLQGV